VSERVVGILSVVAIVFLAALFLPQLVLPGAALYRDVLTPRVVLFLVAPLKILFLFLGAVFAARSWSSFEDRNPVRGAWLLLAIGLGAYAVAQSILAFHQFTRDVTPFPSLADAFFVPATVLVAASLFVFVRVYRAAGLEVAQASEVGVVSSLALGFFAVFFFVAGRPVLESDASTLERALNLAYPALDMVMLVPAALLLRMARQMRGGSLWKVWMTLLVGLFFLAAGDIGFAFFTTLGQASLDPLLDLFYAWSYVLVARAAATQCGILKGSAA
jgi:hypothetical protein